MPGSGGWIEAAPGERTSLSQCSVVVWPVATFFRSTVFFFRSMATASQPVRTSTAKNPLKVFSFARRRLDSFSITPPTWYGRPQFAYET